MGVSCTAALAVLTANFGVTAFVPLAPFLVTQEQVGLVLTVQGAASCVTLPFVGRTVDRVGSPRILWLGLGLQVLSIALLSSNSLLACILSRISQGTASAMNFNAAAAFVMEHSTGSDHAGSLGTVLGAAAVGGLLGPPVAGKLHDVAKDLPLPQVIALSPAMLTLLGACAGLIHVSLLSKKSNGMQDKGKFLIDKSPDCRSSDMDFPPESQSLDQGTKKLGCLHTFLRVYMVVGMQAWVLASSLMLCWASARALACAGVLELHKHGLSAGNIGMTFVPAVLIGALVSPVSGRIATPRRRRSLIVASMLVLATGLAIVTYSALEAGQLQIVLVLSICNLAMAIIDAPSIALMSSLAAVHGCGPGEAITASELAVQAGSALGPCLGAAGFRLMGFGNLCWAFAAGALVMCAICARTLSLPINDKVEDMQRMSPASLLSTP